MGLIAGKRLTCSELTGKGTDTVHHETAGPRPSVKPHKSCLSRQEHALGVKYNCFPYVVSQRCLEVGALIGQIPIQHFVPHYCYYSSARISSRFASVRFH